MRAIATCRVAWSVCVSVGHVREPYKNSGTNRDGVWGLIQVSGVGPKNHVLDRVQFP